MGKRKRRRGWNERQRQETLRAQKPPEADKPAIVPAGSERALCPTCGGHVWKPPASSQKPKSSVKPTSLVPVDQQDLWKNLPPEEPEAVKARISQRLGKKTVVMVGTSPDSVGLAPWGEPGIHAYWGLNDAHHLPCVKMEYITAWFQLHHRWRFTRRTPRYEIDHWGWLQQEHKFPIFMQKHYGDVPNSEKFPLKEVTERYMAGMLGRGNFFQRKYYTCSFSYMIALAMYLGFQRIEIYGVELAQQIEYIMQRPGTEFWLGMAMGSGVQLYLPAKCRILNGVMYGYRWPDKKFAEMNKEPIGIFPEEEDLVGDWDAPAPYPDRFMMPILEYPNMTEDLGQSSKPELGEENAPLSGGMEETSVEKAAA